MAITKDEFIRRVEWASWVMPHLPVTTTLLYTLFAELRMGEPAWWKKTEAAWKDRRLAWTEPWGIFLSALHYEALSDPHNPLIPYFPSCGGSTDAEVSRALLEFLAAAPDSFYENLRAGERRPYAAYRGGLWIPPAGLFFVRRRMPFYLVEINAGAGMNLAADVVRPSQAFDSSYVAARIGLDPRPLSLEDPAQRNWLTAGLMPDQTPWIAALDRDAERVLEAKRSNPSFIQLVECKTQLAPQFILDNLPSNDPEVGLLVFSNSVTGVMTDEEYAAYRQRMADSLRPWNDRAVWVEAEYVRGAKFSVSIQLRAHRFKERLFKHADLGNMNSYVAKRRFDSRAAVDFLFMPPIPIV